VVNAICDMAMVYGLADNKTEIDLDVVLRVIADRQASGVSPFAREGKADDPAVMAEITSLVREAMELRAVPDEEEPTDPVAAMNGAVPLADAAHVNGHAVTESYPRLEAQRADGGQSYDDLRVDALSLDDYRNPPARNGANEGQRPSWFRRTFRRTS
jgi:hypothetical protein